MSAHPNHDVTHVYYEQPPTPREHSAWEGVVAAMRGVLSGKPTEVRKDRTQTEPGGITAPARPGTALVAPVLDGLLLTPSTGDVPADDDVPTPAGMGRIRTTTTPKATR